MSGQGSRRSSSTAVALVALGYPLGMFMARAYSREKLDPVERGFLRLLGRGSGDEQDWKSYAKTVLIFSVGFTRPPLCDPAAPGPSVPEPGSPEGRRAAHRGQHDGELRHEHELAVLRRRVHDVVPDADGRPRRPELRLGSGGHGRADRGRPRHRAPLEQQPRKLLARPLPVARLHPAAALDRPRACC